MSKTFDVNTISRRQALAVATLLPVAALGVSGARAQTPGMERREERREDRQDRREDRRDNRQERREDRREDRRGLRDEPESKNEPAPK